MRILLVDDDRDILNINSIYLERDVYIAQENNVGWIFIIQHKDNTKGSMPNG